MGLIFKFQTSWLETWMASIFHRPPSHFCLFFAFARPAHTKKKVQKGLPRKLTKFCVSFCIFNISGPIAVGLKSGNFPIHVLFFMTEQFDDNKKMNKSEVHHGVIVQTRKIYRTRGGFGCSFGCNSVALISPQGKPLGTRISATLPSRLRGLKWGKFAAMAKKVI